MLTFISGLSGAVAGFGFLVAMCYLGRAQFHETGLPQSGGPLLPVDTAGEDRWAAVGRAASSEAKPAAARCYRRVVMWFLASTAALVVHAITRQLAS